MVGFYRGGLDTCPLMVKIVISELVKGARLRWLIIVLFKVIKTRVF